ncbi:hypothetical protein HYX19_02260 [Candidatus Woesearchaeota archaeon]|nr:hypothetical protein [Candidatus Woesearchaeota archaeon]
MQKLSGWHEKGYHFEVYVPTTIFEPKKGYIKASSNTSIDQFSFKLKEMPKWEVPCQCILLSRNDERSLEVKVKQILRKLPKIRV